MKKIIKEWKNFLSEATKEVLGNKQFDAGAPFITLYHVGWKHPSFAFEFSQDNVFTGEPKLYSKYVRPMGNNALYCSTSPNVANKFKDYSKLSYIYEFRYPSSEMAGRLNPMHGASEEVQEKYLNKWRSKEYGARFQDIRTTSEGIEVAIYDFSKIEVLSVEPLFSKEDVLEANESFFDEIDFLQDMANSFRVSGKFIYEDPNSPFGPDVYELEDALEYVEEIYETYFTNGKTKEMSYLLAMKDLDPYDVKIFSDLFMEIKDYFENYKQEK